MKLTIFAATMLVVWSAVLLAGVPDPAPEKSPVVEKPTPELRARAEAAIKAEIVDLLQKANDKLGFTRAGLQQYELSIAEAAPGDIIATAERQPFKILRSHRHFESPDKATVLAGYYDGKAKAVMTFNQATKAYLPAAEHPLIKAKLALK